MSIEIVKPGPLSTIVGLERFGYRKVGIGSGGAMDLFAMNVANYLVGNQQGAAVIEIYFPSFEIVFHQAHRISITGKGFDALLNGKPMGVWKPLFVEEKSTVTLTAKNNGGRAYLAVKGGWIGQEWLGSFSTHVGVKAGGYFGRSLKKGDAVAVNEDSNSSAKMKTYSWGISTIELAKVYSPSNEIRCMVSVETGLLTEQSKTDFESSIFTITNNSNRMGFRLTGKTMRLESTVELVSSPVDAGTIQLLPDGNLIILMADHQTIGGYPRIASVIKADLPKLAQLNPTEKITFKVISTIEAETLIIERKNQLEEIRKSCFARLNPIISKNEIANT